jgi:hypothetical protein
MANTKSTIVATTPVVETEVKQPLPVRARAAGHRHGRAVGSSAGAVGTYAVGFFQGFVEGAKSEAA